MINTPPHFVFCSVALVLFTHFAIGQENPENQKLNRNRIGVAMGHSHIPSALDEDGQDKLIMIPSWGISYTFRITERSSIGLKSDLEISNYIIEDDKGEELERENPFSLALSFEYKVYKDLGLFVAPGIEFEENEDLFIALFGVFYELEISERLDFTPELVYELKGGHTGAVIFEFGIGYNF